MVAGMPDWAKGAFGSIFLFFFFLSCKGGSQASRIIFRVGGIDG